MSRYYQSHHEDVVQQSRLGLCGGHKVTLLRDAENVMWYVTGKSHETIMSTETM